MLGTRRRGSGRHSPVTMMGMRRKYSCSRQSWPADTRLGSSQMFINVPTTIWLFTVTCEREAAGVRGTEGRALLRRLIAVHPASNAADSAVHYSTDHLHNSFQPYAHAIRRKGRLLPTELQMSIQNCSTPPPQFPARPGTHLRVAKVADAGVDVVDEQAGQLAADLGHVSRLAVALADEAAGGARPCDIAATGVTVSLRECGNQINVEGGCFTRCIIRN